MFCGVVFISVMFRVNINPAKFGVGKNEKIKKWKKEKMKKWKNWSKKSNFTQKGVFKGKNKVKK